MRIRRPQALYKSEMTLVRRMPNQTPPAEGGITEDQIHVLISPPPDSRVWLAMRELGLARPVTRHSVIGPLVQRHGPQADTIRGAWIFADGKPTGIPKPPRSVSGCTRLLGEGWSRAYGALVGGIRHEIEIGRSVTTGLYREIDPGCPQALVVQSYSDPGRSIKAYLMDPGAMAVAAKAAAELADRRGREAQRQRLDEAGRNAVPKL